MGFTVISPDHSRDPGGISVWGYFSWVLLWLHVLTVLLEVTERTRRHGACIGWSVRELAIGGSGVDRRVFFRRSDVFCFFLSWVYYTFKHMFGKYLSINLFVYLFVALISLLSFSLCTYPFCWFDCLVFMFNFFAGCSCFLDHPAGAPLVWGWLIDCLLSWRLISCCLAVIGSRGSIEGIFFPTIPGSPMCVFVLRRGWSWSCWITRKDGKPMKRCGQGFSSPDGSLNCLICWEETLKQGMGLFHLVGPTFCVFRWKSVDLNCFP